jgi:hypothetical protein
VNLRPSIEATGATWNLDGSISKPGVIPRPLAPQLRDHVLRPRSIGMYNGAGDPPFLLDRSPLHQVNPARHRDDNHWKERPHRPPHFKDKAAMSIERLPARSIADAIL